MPYQPAHLNDSAAHMHISDPCSLPSILYTIPHTPPHPLLELFPILPPELACLDVRRALVVRAAEHTNHGEEDRLGGLDGRPALACFLIPVLIVFWWVEDGDADFTVRVDYLSVSVEPWLIPGNRRTIWVVEWCLELHLRWVKWVVGWESELCSEASTCINWLDQFVHSVFLP